MSEDIDLILDWRLIGYDVQEPWEERSNTKQDMFITEINRRATEFIGVHLMPKMKELFSEILDEAFSLSVDDGDPQTLCFNYPRSFDNRGLLQQIRLETGALAAWTPASRAAVTPYIAESLPELFKKPAVSVLTVAPERTFWEKVTILHREAHRTNGKMPMRYSRHYYDLFKLSKTKVKTDAFSNLGLLRQVVDFKMRFYRLNTARYDLARDPKTLRLMPPNDALSLLGRDYRSMKSMFFSEVPSFDEILESIFDLETELHLL